MLYYIKKHPEKLYVKLKKLIVPAMIRGYRLTPVGLNFLLLCPDPPFFKIYMNCDKVEAEEYTIEHQMGAPGKCAKYASAGAGIPFPKIKQCQSDVGGKHHQQGERHSETSQFRLLKKDKACRQQLRNWKQVDQDVGHRMRKHLPVKLHAKLHRIEQLAGCTIDEQQYKQGGRKGTKCCFDVFHLHGTKEGSRTKAKQYEKGSNIINA